MKRQITAVLCFMLGMHLFAQTTISGGAVSGLWTKANSPYIISAAIMVANGTQLTIEPGVEVIFQGSYKFLNLGQITALGTVSDSIIFTAPNSTVGWRGIRFDQTDAANDSSRFVYCRLDFANTANIPSSGGINLDAEGSAFGIANFSKILISHCCIANCTALSAGAIRCGGSGARISNNTFIGNYSSSVGAIECSSFGMHTVISNNLFINNRSTGQSWSYGGAIGTWDDALIYNNVFIHNSSMATDYSGGAIYCGSGSSPKIYNNSFFNNRSPAGGGGAIYCYENTASIYNNLIANNSALTGGGIQCDGAQATLYNNTIANNSASTHGGGMGFTGASPSVKNTIIWGNTANGSTNQLFLADEGSDPNFSYCDIQGGQAAMTVTSNAFYLGTYANNIDADPQFAFPTAGSSGSLSAANALWFLKANSPCIDAGDLSGTYPAYDLSGWPRITNNRIDMGAYEYSITNGIAQNSLASTLHAYPNPSQGKLSLFVPSPGMIDYAVFDSRGALVLSGKKTAEESRINIDLEECSNGIYFVRTATGNGMQSQKIILQK